MSFVHVEMDWRDDNLPLTDVLVFNGINPTSKKHGLPKERTKMFWNHIVSNLFSSDGTVISLYVGSRLVHSLNGSPNRVVISIKEIVHQELYMKKNHQNLSLKQGIYINVFKYLFGFVFYSGVILFTDFSNLLYLGLNGSEYIEES